MDLEKLKKLSSDSNELRLWHQKQLNFNKKLEELLDKKRDEWNEILVPMTNRIKEGADRLVDLQSDILSQRQICTEELTYWMNRLSKLSVETEKTKETRWYFFSTGFGMNTNMTEKKILIDSDLRYLNQNSNLLEAHMEYLRETRSTLDALNWAVKNKIEIYKEIGI